MPTIKTIHAREILDSRANPTVEAEVILDDGSAFRASVPSGASTGSKEAMELRDNDPNRFGGKGVLKAISTVTTTIASALKGKDPSDQAAIDAVLLSLDDDPLKRTIGANATLGVSIACARASGVSLAEHLGGGNLLPTPYMNIINGGAHANNALDIQEFMIVPVGAPSFAEALRSGVEVFHHLKAILAERGLSTAVGDEGGFAPSVDSTKAALDLLLMAIDKAGLAGRIKLALDVAASEIYHGKHYLMEGKALDQKAWIDYLGDLVANYPIISIEDAMDEGDYAGWQAITEVLGDKVDLVGDDLFVTRASLLQEGKDQGMANAILIKPNQVGTVTETLETIRLAQALGYHTMVSHRSGETEDTFIAELALATNAGKIKTGAPSRGERTAKYNALLRLEAALGAKARFQEA